MSVHNGARALPATLASVLSQDGCEYEFIVIDDGSTDETASVLSQFERQHSRLRVVRQSRAGLTKALIQGCDLAAGEFVARQDAGDVSLPGRLAVQLAFMRDHPQAVMTACAARFVGPENELLYEVRRTMLDLDRGLRSPKAATVSGPPHHGATMFRREAYRRVGGYRAPFVVAQDLDLWLRLAENGQCLGMEQLLYQARLDAGNISSRRREEQLYMTKIALDCRQARVETGSDGSVLAEMCIPAIEKGPLMRSERARFHYFVASCLRHRDPRAARAYYGAALRDNPLSVKAAVRWVATHSECFRS